MTKVIKSFQRLVLLVISFAAIPLAQAEDVSCNCVPSPTNQCMCVQFKNQYIKSTFKLSSAYKADFFGWSQNGALVVTERPDELLAPSSETIGGVKGEFSKNGILFINVRYDNITDTSSSPCDLRLQMNTNGTCEVPVNKHSDVCEVVPVASSNQCTFNVIFH